MQTHEQAREDRIARKKRQGGWAEPKMPKTSLNPPQASTVSTTTAGMAADDAVTVAADKPMHAGDECGEVGFEGTEKVRGERRVLARHADQVGVS